MSDAGKDLFNDMQSSETPFDEATCEVREALLKTLTGKGDKEAGNYRYMVLKEIGMCEFNRGNFDKAKKRLDSGIGELNLPNDDMMLTNQDLAPTGLLREAAKFMTQFEYTQAATSLRRSSEISGRNLKRILKMVHKQMGQQNGAQGNVPPLDNLVAELPGFGKTGQYLPMLLKQVPILKQEMPYAEQIDKAVEEMDKRLAGFAPQAKAIRKTLDTSKGSKAGSLMYVRGLVTEATVPGDRFMAAMSMVEDGLTKAFTEEAASAEKSLTLLKRTKQGGGCEEGKGMTKTCAALAKIPDLKSNSFGETRMMIVKPGKESPLDACTTNANVGILLAAKDGVTVKVAGEEKSLVVGLPIVVDFCQAVVLTATQQAPVLFAQAWHPEFAAVERTTEIRARAKTFSLSEDEVKEAAKIVNDHAKKNYEKSGKQWRNESPFITSMKSSLQADKDGATKKAEEAAEAKRKEDEGGDEGRAKALEELEKKRAEKKKKAEALEQKKADRAKVLELEKSLRDPWLNAPEVAAVEAKLAALKEERRDASAKLEFDVTAQLTKDISAAERELKKAIKVAKKAFKKSGGKVDTKAKEEAVAASEEVNIKRAAEIKAKELKKLNDALEEVKKKKAVAAETENFKEAKKLKKVQKELEDELKKLEL